VAKNSDKIAKGAGHERLSESHPPSGWRVSAVRAASSLPDLHRTLGNQAMLGLLNSGMVQAKLRVSQPGDADEQEADRATGQAVSARPKPVLQRKCACGRTCSKCREEAEQEGVIHRSAVGALRALPFSIQRAVAEGQDQARHPGERAVSLIVEDDALSVAPGQMHKTQFLTLLQSSACATADAVLESVGHTTKGCPYIKKWLDRYKGKDAQHLTRAMHKYAPETLRARSAHEAIALVNHRVERAALSWARTGKVSDLPEGIHEEMGGGRGFLGAVAKFAHSGFGSALLGFVGGSQKERGELQKKSRDGASGGEHDAAQVKAELGSGQSLQGGVQSRMSAAFGYDFSGVRVHTDAKAGELSSQLNARAFTIGSDVAFAGGEYQPGTPIGDALIAHELAHVVQQGGGKQAGPQTKDAGLGDDGSLEQDADRSAVGAVVAAWTGARKGLAEIGVNGLPRLKSGLKLQRCASCGKAPPANAPGKVGTSQCTTPSPDEWKAAVTAAQAITEPDKQRDALFRLVQQAVCPLGLTVQNAGTKNKDEIDPDDYAPFPVVNFDINLNGKQSWPRRGKTCKKEPLPSSIKPEDCKKRSLDRNAGYNFRVGDTLYLVAGPKSVDPDTPAITRRLAEHEKYLAKNYTAKADSAFQNDAELDAWTQDFVNYFHLPGYKQGTRYSGNSWEPLPDLYYEGPDTSDAARKKAVEQLYSYYKTPPASAAAAGAPGHPTVAKDVQELFSLWLARMGKLKPSRQLIKDLQARISTP
jgi:hypothetical protein